MEDRPAKQSNRLCGRRGKAGMMNDERLLRHEGVSRRLGLTLTYANGRLVERYRGLWMVYEGK
jgi:hypothetical protein